MIIYGVGKSSAELAALNGSLQDLLDGIQVLFSNYCLFMWKPSRAFGICCCFVEVGPLFVDVTSKFRSFSLAMTCRPIFLFCVILII